MRYCKPAENWKHRKLYEYFIFKKRKPVTKFFTDAFQRDSCRISLVRLKKRRSEKFYIIQKGLSITIADERITINEDSY